MKVGDYVVVVRGDVKGRRGVVRAVARKGEELVELNIRVRHVGHDTVFVDMDEGGSIVIAADAVAVTKPFDPATTCVACGRYIDIFAGEGCHFPYGEVLTGRIKELRETQPARPMCIDCLPYMFKSRFLGGARPILCAADLPKVGEPIPDHVVCKKDPR